MSIFASDSNLAIVQKAITDLVEGTRIVSVEYTDINGRRTSRKYTEVSLNELRMLELHMQNSLNPVPLMQSMDVEILF